MIKVIYKYPLTHGSVQQIEMPYDAEVLCVQMNNGIPCLWALHSKEKGVAKLSFEMFGTGHPIPEGTRKYIGTFQVEELGAMYVFHVFQLLSL